MKTKLRGIVAIAVAVLAVNGSPGTARAMNASDVPGAILTFPYIVVDTANGVDTVLAMSNVSTSPITALCILSNTNRHCTNTFAQCSDDSECAPTGSCEATWFVTDFTVDLTQRQPIGWRASQGLIPVPLGSSNIPPTPEDPFVGSMQCYAVDGTTQQPVERNDLQGTATIERYQTTPAAALDAAKYNAIGLAAIPGTNNGDDILVLGGPQAEYDACPGVNILNHFFEGAIDPVSKKTRVYTTLALVPCSYDRVGGKPGAADVDYLVFNEFEQRFQVMKSFTNQQISHLSDIDPVFDVGTAGSLVGQTRLRSASGGVLGVAIEERWSKRNPTLVSSAGLNLFTQGIRVDADYIGAQQCGDGIIEDNEQCDDGNQISGDGCSNACQIEPCFTCSGEPSVCGPPTSCVSPAKSSLILHDVTNPNRDHVNWSWTGTAAVADFGSPTDPSAPTGETGYSLCVFDGPHLALQAKVQGGDCGKNPCWTDLGTDGFKYANGRTNAQGVNSAKLKQGTGNAQLLFNAKGARLALPGPVTPTQYFNQAPDVTVYLVKDDGPECWQSVFPANTANTGTDFKAMIP